MSRRDGVRRTGVICAGVLAVVGGGGTAALASGMPADLLPSPTITSLPLPLPTTLLSSPAPTTTSPIPTTTTTPAVAPTTTAAPTSTSGGGTGGTAGGGAGTGGGGSTAGAGGLVHGGSALRTSNRSSTFGWGSGSYGRLSIDPQLLSSEQLGLGQFGFAGAAVRGVRPPLVAGPPGSAPGQPVAGRTPDPAVALHSLASAEGPAGSPLSGGLAAVLAALGLGAVAAGHLGYRRVRAGWSR